MTCDSAWTSCRSERARSRQACGVDAGGLEQLLAEGAAELARRAGPAPSRRGRRRGARASSRWSAGRWRPSPMTTSPARTRSGPSRSSASTTPVAAPATSYSSGPSRPGCSAVSPPTSATPAPDAGGGDARDDGRDPLRDDLAAGDVVGHEQRLGAAHDDVVDDHADEVEADGVVHVHAPARWRPWCRRRRWRWPAAGAGTPSGRWRRTARRTRRGRRGPRGGWAGVTEAFISSTALSPASTSTPAAA